MSLHTSAPVNTLLPRINVLFESQNGAAKQTVQTDELGTPVSDPEFTCNESTHDLGCVLAF